MAHEAGCGPGARGGACAHWALRAIANAPTTPTRAARFACACTHHPTHRLHLTPTDRRRVHQDVAQAVRRGARPVRRRTGPGRDAAVGSGRPSALQQRTPPPPSLAAKRGGPVHAPVTAAARPLRASRWFVLKQGKIFWFKSDVVTQVRTRRARPRQRATERCEQAAAPPPRAPPAAASLPAPRVARRSPAPPTKYRPPSHPTLMAFPLRSLCRAA